MINLYLDNNNACKLTRSKNAFKNKTFGEGSKLIFDGLRNGVSFIVHNKNTHVQPHRGSYYLVYLNEYNMAMLLYIDVSKELRILYYGDMNNAVYSMYRCIATGTTIKLLKSDGKKAYRVVDNNKKAVSFKYKDKDSVVHEQKYMMIFDAINYAIKMHKKTGKEYSVNTKSGTVLLSI